MAAFEAPPNHVLFVKGTGQRKLKYVEKNLEIIREAVSRHSPNAAFEVVDDVGFRLNTLQDLCSRGVENLFLIYSGHSRGTQTSDYPLLDQCDSFALWNAYRLRFRTCIFMLCCCNYNPVKAESQPIFSPGLKDLDVFDFFSSETSRIISSSKSGQNSFPKRISKGVAASSFIYNFFLFGWPRGVGNWDEALALTSKLMEVDGYHQHPQMRIPDNSEQPISPTTTPWWSNPFSTKDLHLLNRQLSPTLLLIPHSLKTNAEQLLFGISSVCSASEIMSQLVLDSDLLESCGRPLEEIAIQFKLELHLFQLINSELQKVQVISPCTNLQEADRFKVLQLFNYRDNLYPLWDLGSSTINNNERNLMEKLFSKTQDLFENVTLACQNSTHPQIASSIANEVQAVWRPQAEELPPIPPTRMYVGVAGTSGSGKSTLLNAMTSHEILPTGVSAVVTAFPIQLSHIDDESFLIEIHFCSEGTLEEDISCFHYLCQELRNTRKMKRSSLYERERLKNHQLSAVGYLSKQ